MNRINLLNTIIEEFLRENDVDSLLEKAILRLTGILQAQRVTFYFINNEAKELWSYAVTDLEINEIRVALGEGIAGICASRKKIINVKDAYKCCFFNKNIDRRTGFRTRTVLCAPLINREGKLIGVVQAINKKEATFTTHDEEIIKSLSLYLAISLENIRLLQEQEALFRSTLYALAGAIDAKDPTTAGHSYRVAYFSVKIAKELGFSPEDIKIVEYAAYLHDVGKIGIPDSILGKKTQLTDDEFAVIKKHPLYTMQILNNIIFSRETKPIPFIASCHHEYLDGSGYPFGLKGKKVNIFSRIIAVADIYDALTAFDRPYKKHMKIKQALAILEEQARKNHLDKKIVALLIHKALYKYELRRYTRLDLHTAINYKIISQKRIIAEGIKDETRITEFNSHFNQESAKRSVDISSGGMLFIVKLYIPVGTFLDLEIEIFSKKIKCLGKVVRIERLANTVHYRVGVSFINMAPLARNVLQKQLKRLWLKKKSK